MGYLEFRREPPSNLTTMVVAFAGWTDAGDAGTGALRTMVRRLPAERLASIDPEEFFDFTQVRPFVRITADGNRTVRWPGNDLFLWQGPGIDTGLLLLRGTEPSLKWRTFTTLVLDLAERCGVQRIVSLGASLAALPHTRPTRVSGTSTDPQWQAMLEAWGILRQRRPSYQGPTGISSVFREAAAQRGIPYASFMGQAPHYIQGTFNPEVTRALLSYVCPLLGITLDLSWLDRAAQEFKVECDQIVAQGDSEMQVYVRRLEQDYDDAATPQTEPITDEESNPEGLVRELEEFLRREREGGTSAS